MHLYFVKGPLDQIKAEGGDAGGVGYGGGGDTGTNGRPIPNVSQAAKRVYQTLKDSPQNNEGLHVQNIAASVGMNVADVKKAGDELLSHSMIFTTVDDDTWAVLDY